MGVRCIFEVSIRNYKIRTPLNKHFRTIVREVEA